MSEFDASPVLNAFDFLLSDLGTNPLAAKVDSSTRVVGSSLDLSFNVRYLKVFAVKDLIFC